jgi:hypothetical protein
MKQADVTNLRISRPVTYDRDIVWKDLYSPNGHFLLVGAIYRISSFGIQYL